MMFMSAPARILRDGGLLTSHLVSSRSRAAVQQIPARTARMLCHAANAEKDILRGVQQEHREVVARVAENGEAAVERWSVYVTPFLEPPALADAMLVVGRMAEAEARPAGGYPNAERCRLLVGRPEVLDGEDPGAHLAVAEVQGNFLFDPASHRDFLGAVLGTGIERSRVGDIIVQGERGAQVVTTPEMAEYLQGMLTQVRSVKVSTTRVGLDKLKVAPPKIDTMRTVEASLRLDAIASAAFRLSRSKMQEVIDGGDVRVNWKSGIKGSSAVKQGDVITVRGKGRVVIGEVTKTAKERFAIELQRYL